MTAIDFMNNYQLLFFMSIASMITLNHSFACQFLFIVREKNRRKNLLSPAFGCLFVSSSISVGYIRSWGPQYCSTRGLVPTPRTSNPAATRCGAKSSSKHGVNGGIKNRRHVLVTPILSQGRCHTYHNYTYYIILYFNTYRRRLSIIRIIPIIIFNILVCTVVCALCTLQSFDPVISFLFVFISVIPMRQI